MTPPCWFPGCCTSRRETWNSCAGSCPEWRHGWPRRHTPPGRSCASSTDFQFGDWLDPAAPPNDPGAADPLAAGGAGLPGVLGVDRVAGGGRCWGRTASRCACANCPAGPRAVFRKHYIADDGRLQPATQTSYALALRFGLLEPEEHPAAGRRLAETVAADGYRIATGFVGTPLVTDALSDEGQAEAAYRLLLQTECPSWLYPVTMGATTIWERWDSMLPDGSINPGEMTSFNHYALGAVADWMHRTVAGLAPAGPGTGNCWSGRGPAGGWPGPPPGTRPPMARPRCAGSTAGHLLAVP